MKFCLLSLFSFLLSFSLYAQELAETYFVNAEIQLVLGDTVGAMNNYNNAAYFETDSAKKHHCQGYIHYLEKNYIEAIQAYTLALSFEPMNPSNATIYFDRALANEKLGRKNEALEDYSWSTKVQPTYLSGYYSQAKLYSQCGKFDLAIQNYTTVISLNAEYAEAYFMRGMAQLGAKNYSAAIQDFTKAIALNPDQTEAEALKRTAERNLSRASASSSRL